MEKFRRNQIILTEKFLVKTLLVENLGLLVLKEVTMEVIREHVEYLLSLKGYRKQTHPSEYEVHLNEGMNLFSELLKDKTSESENNPIKEEARIRTTPSQKNCLKLFEVAI